ncbi:formin 1 [Cricetulus griseus]
MFVFTSRKPTMEDVGPNPMDDGHEITEISSLEAIKENLNYLNADLEKDLQRLDEANQILFRKIQKKEESVQRSKAQNDSSQVVKAGATLEETIQNDMEKIIIKKQERKFLLSLSGGRVLARRSLRLGAGPRPWKAQRPLHGSGSGLEHGGILAAAATAAVPGQGEVRGFSYKGAVTLDRSNNAFHNCYQVREGPDITSLSQQPKEHPGDIFFKQIPTRDILTELYKLTAERERLLDSLLRSDHILGISMGNQEGKLQELSVSLAREDDCFQSAGSWNRELIRRSTQGNKKPRRSGRRRDSPEELWQKRTRRKGRGQQESSAPGMGKDQVCSSSSLPPSRVRPNLRLLEERGNLVPQGTLTSSPRRRRESCPANILRTPDADLGFGSSGRTSEDTDLEGPLSSNGSPTEVGDAGIGRQLKSPREREPPSLPESHEKHSGAERVGTRKSKSLERTCRKKPVSKVVAKVQELSAEVQRVVRAHPDGEGRVAFCSETQTEFISKADFLILPGAKDETQSSRRLGEEQQGVKSLQPQATERASIPSEPAINEGAVNKVLWKVIESEKLDEATEGKTLGFSLNTRATHTFSQTGSQRKAGLSQSGHKFLLLDLPHTGGPDSPQPKCDERKPIPQTPTALSMVFNNSSPQSSAHKRLSPVPSPLSPRCPSPQQHHRILPLPPLPSEGEAVFNECPSRKNGVSSGFPSAVTLEPSSSTKVTETKGGSPTSLRASQTWLLSEEPSEKSLRPEKISAAPQHQPPPG